MCCDGDLIFDTSDLLSFAPEHTPGRPGEDNYGHVTRFDRNLMRMQIKCRDIAGGVDALIPMVAHRGAVQEGVDHGATVQLCCEQAPGTS